MLQLSGEGKAREIYGNGLQSASSLLWRFAVPPWEAWEERPWGWRCVPVAPACPSQWGLKDESPQGSADEGTRFASKPGEML